MVDDYPQIGSVIRSVLPGGTNPSTLQTFLTDQSKATKVGPDLLPWHLPPVFPPDLFAVAGQLCKLGGVTAYFDPSPWGENNGDAHFVITRDDRDRANGAAEIWRTLDVFTVPELVSATWTDLIQCWTTQLAPPNDSQEAVEPLDWWKPALMLTMIADMACSRVLKSKLPKAELCKNCGQRHTKRDRKADREPELEETPFERWIRLAYLLQEQKSKKDGSEFTPPASLTQQVDTGIVCVLPKMRISPVGATIRNVSRNLSLLPGRGEVRCYWESISSDSLPLEDNDTLDILLIPEPRKISAQDFRPESNGGRSLAELRSDKWNWDHFHLHQGWIDTPKKRQQFLSDCTKLLRAAHEETRCVNAIVLPEYAIDYGLFEKLCAKLKVIEPGLEFIIAGSSDNCYGQSGNHVLTKVWDNQLDPGFSIAKSRRKHHRWRMNRSQVEAYGLSSVLNPKILNWWEKTTLGRRKLFFHRFREASAFSVLICEELARSDPCHEILRSVAPNLIFALLLDGPQIKQRWPAQYASNLADDPGSSVLTFTSYGLIHRSNRQGHFDPNHSIALWKDDSGRFVEIPMPSGDGPRGVLLSLWSEHVLDITLTGKRSQERAWRYSAHFPIRAE